MYPSKTQTPFWLFSKKNISFFHDMNFTKIFVKKKFIKACFQYSGSIWLYILVALADYVVLSMAFASCPLTYWSTVVVVCTDSLTASSSPTQRRRRRSSAPCRRRRRENLSCCCCLVLLKYKKAPVLHTVLLLLAAAVGQYMQSPASSARTLRPRTSSCTTTTTTWSFWPLLCVRGLANLRQHKKKKKKTKQSNRRILLIARRALDTALYTACQYTTASLLAVVRGAHCILLILCHSSTPRRGYIDILECTTTIKSLP